MPDIFVGEFGIDVTPPLLSGRFPASNEDEVAKKSTIQFDLFDEESDVDLQSVVITVNGEDVHANGVSISGWSVTANLIAVNTWHFTAIKTAGFSANETVNVSIQASDQAGIPNFMAIESWTFFIEQGIIESPRLFAEAGEKVIQLKWNVHPDTTVVSFELRRSRDSTPVAIDDGDLVYVGTNQFYEDTDVINGAIYYYTIFLVYKYEGPVPVYVAYDQLASASAIPRLISVGQFSTQEYVPSRGEFGKSTAVPLINGTLSSWGDLQKGVRRNTDLIYASQGSLVYCPITGVVESVTSDSISILSQVGGFRFTLSGIKVLAVFVAGRKVKAGEVLSSVSGKPLEFSVFKLPTGRYGIRTVRPSYFYLMVEARDGGR